MEAQAQMDVSAPQHMGIFKAASDAIHCKFAENIPANHRNPQLAPTTSVVSVFSVVRRPERSLPERVPSFLFGSIPSNPLRSLR